MTEIYDYQNEVRKRAEAAANAQREANNREVWETVLNHWDISSTEANFRVVLDFCGDGELTVEKFKTMLESGQGEDLDWNGTRDRIVQEIADLLSEKGERHAYDSARAIAAMRYWEKPKLRARLAELKFRAGKTGQDARVLLEAHRDAERGKFYPYEDMPDSITPESVREMLNTSAGRNKWRQLNARYGHAQVEARRLS
jgi:hypothetical protein